MEGLKEGLDADKNAVQFFQLAEKNWGKTQTPKLKNLNADNLLHTCVGVQLGKFIGVV